MTYVIVYILIGLSISAYLYSSLSNNPDAQAYIWNYEMDDELRQYVTDHPWAIPTSFIGLALIWPIVLITLITPTDEE